MKMKRRVRSPLHHPAFATLTTGGPPPPLSRGRKASAAVLAARFSSHPSHRHTISKNDAANRPSSDAPGSGTAGRTMIGRGARRFVGWAKARNAPCPRVSQNRVSQNRFLKTAWASLRSTHPTKRTNEKGNRTPTDAGLPASPSGEARTLARARSPVGVPLRLSPGRQLVPKAQRQAMLSGTVRSVRSCTAAPTGERRPCASPCMIRKSGCRFSGKIMHHSRALPAPEQIPVQ